MGSKEVVFHKEALAEYETALGWYLTRSERAAMAFSVELDHDVAAIAEAPNRCAKGPKGTRKFVLRQFPFIISYRELPSFIQVVAVAHGGRRPGYWKERL
jgi:plasmid stabilization system protein ParE